MAEYFVLSEAQGQARFEPIVPGFVGSLKKIKRRIQC